MLSPPKQECVIHIFYSHLTLLNLTKAHGHKETSFTYTCLDFLKNVIGLNASNPLFYPVTVSV